MPKLKREERLAIAKARLLRILKAQDVATMRTLEMKIADAGPYGQRIDPHIITDAREELMKEGRLRRLDLQGTSWYFRVDLSKDRFDYRMSELLPVQKQYSHQNFTMRLGQSLEIATYKALCNTDNDFSGQFPSLNDHGDDKIYSKDEPPGHLGKRAIPNKQRLDFMMRSGNEWAGIECKNIREWIYPSRSEVYELLSKCMHLDCIPVLIARRIHPSTFFVMNKCGVLIHQTYNQIVPASDEKLALEAKNKNLLGYADIKVGNDADARLVRFVKDHLPELLGEAREKFEKYKDLVKSYLSGEHNYKTFAGKVRRRSQGRDENYDFIEDDDFDPDDEA